MLELLVDKTDFRNVRLAETPAPELAPGMARLRLDVFALTSNNITYAAMGEGPLGYWEFFPGPDGWGKPPCWGFATVIGSRAEGVAEGQRVYGYFPIAEMLDVAVTRAGARGFVDGAAHRVAKAAVYNQYLTTDSDPAYEAECEPEQTIFRPLYATGWWAADCVFQRAPRSVIVSSASAKTAMAMAHRLRALGVGDIVALTSPRNAEYVASTGLFDRVTTYEAIDRLETAGPATFVDFLGRDDVIHAVHRRLGADLTRSILIGATDWGDKSGGIQPPLTPPTGVQPEFFFVPDYAASRLREDSTVGVGMIRDLRAFYGQSSAFVTVRRVSGGDAILKSWRQLADSVASPREGIVLTF